MMESFALRFFIMLAVVHAGNEPWRKFAEYWFQEAKLLSRSGQKSRRIRKKQSQNGCACMVGMTVVLLAVDIVPTITVFTLAGGDPANGNEETTGDFFVPWHLPLYRCEGQRPSSALNNQLNCTESSSSSMAMEVNSGQVNEDKGTVMFHRFYHLFVQNELCDLCAKIGGLNVIDSFFDKSNWCVIVQKL